MRIILLALFTSFLVVSARAHQVDAVALDFEPKPNKWEFFGIVDLTFMMPETRNDPDAEVIRRWDVMRASAQEHERMRSEVEKVWRRCFSLSENGQSLSWQIEFEDFKTTPLALVEDPEDWALFQIRISAKRAPESEAVTINWNDETGAALLLQREAADEWLVYEVQAEDSLRVPYVAEPLEDEPVFFTDERETSAIIGDLESGLEEKERLSNWLVIGAVAILGASVISGLFFCLSSKKKRV